MADALCYIETFFTDLYNKNVITREELYNLRSSLKALVAYDVNDEPKKGDEIVSLLDENQKGVIVQIDDNGRWYCLSDSGIPFGLDNESQSLWIRTGRSRIVQGIENNQTIHIE